MISRKNELISGVLLVAVISIVSMVCLHNCGKKIYKESHTDTSIPAPIHVSKDANGTSHNLQDVQRIKELETAQQLLLAENSRLRSFQTKVDFGVHHQEVIKEVPVPYAVHDTIKDSNAISVPKHIRWTGKNYKISGNILKVGSAPDTLDWKDSFTVNVGEPKDSTLGQRIKYIFKSRPVVSEVITYDKDDQISGMRSITYIPEKTFLEKPVTWFGIGIISALTVEYLLVHK